MVGGTGLLTALLAVTVVARSTEFDQQPAATPQTAKAPAATPDYNALVDKYCVECHNDRSKKGNLSLAKFDIAKAGENADVTERMIRKLQAGMMPPPGVDRPTPTVYASLISTLETKADAASALRPNPGARPFPRLNRAEYARAIKDLLAIDVDAGSWLPQDTMNSNFDNIADEQVLSATLLESYLNAATDIVRLALGDRNATTSDRTYTNGAYVSQHPWDQLEGAPYGTRGGMVVNHNFPADAEYVFAIGITSGDNSRFEDVDISVDGERVTLIRYENGQPRDADGRGGVPMPSEPVFLKAGQHKVSVTFVRRFDGPYEDLIRPHDWSFAGGGSGGGGITTLPHLRDFTIRGPFKVTGVSETPSRQKVFTCRPTSAAEERPCARRIVSHLGSQAYRRPLTLAQTDALLAFYDAGAAKSGFEGGVRLALEAILASPQFLFRLERQPDGVKPGTVYRVSDIDLASRLSFFIWGAPPDQELIGAATRGELALKPGIEKQVRRMLKDPRAEALGTRFAAQWLRLQDIEKVHPDPNFFPNFDDNLAGMMRRETIEFFNYLVRDDRSALDLYKADYSFLNERLARHYGIPGVGGNTFRKVTYPDDTRRGLLGQGSVLVQTSYANRTTPVLRGKWVMEVLLGTPPPPPPMDGSVAALEETAESKDGKILTTRERLELHRKNPSCNSCHRFIDPIGLALDNFDVTGKWRQRENGQALETLGEYYDGTEINTPAELSAVLLKRPIPLVRTFTENLMAYGLGRRVEYYDQPTVRAVAKAAAANDYKMSTFILGIATSDAFRMKRADAAPVTPSKPNVNGTTSTTGKSPTSRRPRP
jgi:mono/diheme cytochrome c family protein